MYRLMGISVVCAACAAGQIITTDAKAVADQKQIVTQVRTAGEFGPIGVTAALAGPTATVAGAPYSAQAVTEQVQVLADGNRIVQTATGSVARDAQGRVRRDEPLPGFSANSSDAPHLVMIDDPVAGVHWTLESETKTAMKMPFAQTKAGATGRFVPPPVGADRTWFITSDAPPPGANIQLALPSPDVQIQVMKTRIDKDDNVSKIDLGTQTMQGVPVQGTRLIRTIPSGEMGNEQPIVITTETWYSPDLKVLVMSRSSDPRMGETTYKLLNLQRGDPAASLFVVPDDYTVKDQPGKPFIYLDTKKPE